MNNLKIASAFFLLCILFSCDEYDLVRTNRYDPRSKNYRPSVPELITTAATAVTNNSATMGGKVTFDGGTIVTARGVCWKTSTGPTTSNNKTSDGNGIGSFSSHLTGLTPGITYFVRAYATNSVGTAYGNELSFITNAVIPTLTTTAIGSVTATTASSGGIISSDGGATVTTRGVCWSTANSPTISNSKTTDGNGTGSYESNLTGLTGNTKYYVRAYATNSAGTAYGDELSFTTSAVIPTLITTSVILTSTTTATSGGNVTSDGGEPVIARGVCWSTYKNPTIINSNTSDGLGTGIFMSSINGLTSGNIYYVRAYATNSIGTAYGNEISFCTLSTGDSFQGGKLAYILQSGDPGYKEEETHGLIAAPDDQSENSVWGCYNTAINGADGTAIGTGAQNTIDIVAGCMTAGIAARLCYDLVLGGYSDWYLPSKDELNKLYLNKALIGGFTSNYYWSSSEVNIEYAWVQFFLDGSPTIGYKEQYPFSFSVRAVRAF